MQLTSTHRPEILAPAGGPAQVEAALAAGADAIFFGLGELDARRGADGFTLADIPGVVERIHAAKAKAHLTLNIQLGWRELGRAARTLAYAERCGVDAVLIADPGLLLLAPAFPNLHIHFSTQAGISSPAGVAAAQHLGVERVVLARELSLDEIAPCTGIGPEIEVFVQGALCFSVSGRCSLTSWVGGRSGNRGTCTSICRVKWSCNDAGHARPMDMKDASAVRVVQRLQEIGVASFKIEGRLKTAQWVGEAVALYRRAVAGTADPEALWADAQKLGAYTGREMTDAYLNGSRVGLIHPDEGRSSGNSDDSAHGDSDRPFAADQDPPRELTVVVRHDGRSLVWELTSGNRGETFLTPHTVANPRRDCGTDEIAERIRAGLPPETALATITDAVGGLRLPRRTANDIATRIIAFMRPRQDGIDRLKIVIPDAARAVLDGLTGHPANTHPLTTPPDRARCDDDAALTFAAAIATVPVVVECRTVASLERLHAGLGKRFVCALPPVIYADDVADLTALCQRACALGVVVEANGWDGFWLAHTSGCGWEAGPGFGILNPLAAKLLADHGARHVQISPEADAEKLADMSARCPAPLIVPVYGRPPLMTTRAWKNAPPWTMEDARGEVQIRTRREGPVVVLRPIAPFDWRAVSDPRFRSAHREMDLSAAADPVAEWRSAPAAKARRFNLDRTLR